MFVQVIQGKAKDATQLRRQWERWDEELKPTAEGFLGGTAGVARDGEFIALVRFEDETAARANSSRTEQGQWWNETSQYIEDVVFHDCDQVDLLNEGGSDEAGFVQVIHGKVTDVEKARELDKSSEEQLRRARPDIIGGLTAWHPEYGRHTTAVYFASEAEARAKEQEAVDVPEFQQYMSEYEALSDGEPEYLDLTDPWYSSP